MNNFIQNLINDNGLKVLIIVIVLDTIFGILRAIKEKELNSCIGIDGIIRKVGMLITIIFVKLLDLIIDVNLIGFLPEELREILNLQKVGISSLFNLMFVVFEILSIFKNAIKCKLPMPKKFQEFLEKIMEEFTGELTKVNVITTNEVKIQNPNNIEIKK